MPRYLSARFVLFLRLAVVLSLALSLVTLAAPEADAGVDKRAESQFRALVNKARARHGVRRMRSCRDLRSVARKHSREMARSGSLHHNANLASEVGAYSALAENIAYGGGGRVVHQALMDSSGHRANILAARYSEVGVGVRSRGSTLWVTQIFRDRSTRGRCKRTGRGRIRGRPLVGDWNGDGTDSPGWYHRGVFRLSDGFSRRSHTWRFRFGRRGDRPIVGDWDRDGRDTIGVRRGRIFYLRNWNSGGHANRRFRFGPRRGTPLAGDWDRDGRDSIGVKKGRVYRLRNRNSRGRAHRVFRFGHRRARPLVGDWNGDRRDTIGIRRGNRFLLRNKLNRGPAQVSFRYGRSKDRAVAGDWRRRGRRDTVGVVRGRRWRLRRVHRARHRGRRPFRYPR